MLRLNRMTDYGIVVLGALAHRRGEVIATASLAELTGINQPTVAKVAKLLLGAGLVETQRGVNGGYRLAFPAESISLVHIIESIEAGRERTRRPQRDGRQSPAMAERAVR